MYVYQKKHFHMLHYIHTTERPTAPAKTAVRSIILT